jgi:ribosome recycling factor
MLDDILQDVEVRMKKSISALQKDFAAIRTGRASVAMFDGITVSVTVPRCRSTRWAPYLFPSRDWW